MPSRWRAEPAAIRPMLASLAAPPLAQPGLVYEPKYDGIRALVDVRPPARKGADPVVALYSRNGREKHVQFPGIVRTLAAMARRLPGPVLLDAEIVAVDRTGTPLGFQHIQQRIHLTSPAEIERAERLQPTALIAFDLLRDGDEDLRSDPLAARRLRLQARVRPDARQRRWVRLSELAADDGHALLERARRDGWEGLIVKDGDSIYQSGKRTPAWRKLKLLEQQEFVVGGWTEPRESRAHFGALLVGYYDDARLRWAGSVGTGFDQAELVRVGRLLRDRETRESPFADRVRTAERAHWVRPDLVAEVRFTEWTSDGLLRQPVYLGMREDKEATSVRRERRRAKGRGQRAKVKGEGEREGKGEKAKGSGPPRHRNRREVGTGTGPVIDQLTALEASGKDGEIALPNGDLLRVTNLRKVFWPKAGLTKGDLLRYYAEVAPMLLPAVDDRPLVMRRFPNGVDGPAFYQQRHPEDVPQGVRRAVLPAGVDPITEEGPRDRLIGGSLTTLLYMAQIAAISQDPWFSRVADPLHMDYAAIDLDPGDGATFARVLDVARWVKDVLDRFRIPAWPKTSGASGMHIYIPLPAATTYDTGQLLGRMIATMVADEHPKAATVVRAVRSRPHGTVYVDFLQNILGKTLATAYSARASEYAGVSTPLTWNEVERGVDPRDFTIETAPARFRAAGDLWTAFRTAKPVDLAALTSR
ncbi:MAG: DNA ligase D [Acidobacteria bacterium]|nr:DNA ligase D [Acidobacteriota bacterium]